ncbi:zinc-binding dehydrogenase [Streptomyces sp. ISL-43]|uniref:zinc-binding dehydrogenase n=1 Tax=Streptomyces sp. ISL-43 TaxID=2819183 RepID=UPI0035A874F7
MAVSYQDDAHSHDRISRDRRLNSASPPSGKVPSGREDEDGRVGVPVHESRRGPAARAHALIDAGRIRPVVDRVFPFEETLEALRYVALTARRARPIQHRVRRRRRTGSR